VEERRVHLDVIPGGQDGGPALMPATRADICRVLVVEDDQDVRESLSILLERHSYAVSAAVHGEDALERFRAGYRPHVMLLDLDMPVMDGFRLLEEIRKDPDWGEVRIIILSALRDSSRIRELGVHDYLTKPVGVATLLRAIETQWSALRDRIH
jgi:CheY-like chemotaxis protein